MAPAVLLSEAVCLSGRFPLLAGVSLEIGEGEVAHVRGANGAGKTSLLRLLAGLLRLHSGSATVLGEDLSVDQRAARRRVGMLGHETFLYEELTIEENLAFALRSFGLDTSRAASAALRLGLAGRLSRTPVSRLSQGQKRRTALAVLLARDPRLWLLDEPHAGLDEEGRLLLDELVSQSRERGRTVVLCSHEHERAEELSDRVIVMAGGRVLKEHARVA